MEEKLEILYQENRDKIEALKTEWDFNVKKLLRILMLFEREYPTEIEFILRLMRQIEEGHIVSLDNMED